MFYLLPVFLLHGVSPWP